MHGGRAGRRFRVFFCGRNGKTRFDPVLNLKGKRIPNGIRLEACGGTDEIQNVEEKSLLITVQSLTKQMDSVRKDTNNLANVTGYKIIFLKRHV
jgi:hypothetical protein